MFRQLLAAGAALVCFSSVASAYDALPQPEKHEKISIVEPQLRIAKGGPASPQVALTLDACMGKTDHRILDVLVENRIPATVFVTARWLKQNAEAFAVMKAHPDLFDIENHGNLHVPAITNVPTMYNIKTAGSLDAVRFEIDGGADAIAKSGSSKPQWYRDATARYSTDAVKLAESMGYKIGGYSLNGDQGASLLAPVVARRISAARDGDVIISHINQPTRSAGEGVAKGWVLVAAAGGIFAILALLCAAMGLRNLWVNGDKGGARSF